MTREYKLAFLGFGNVGKALARLFLQKRDELEQRYGITFLATGIYTARHGAAINHDGLDLEAVLQASDYDDFCTEPRPRDAFDFIRRCGAHVLFENSPVNYESGQPAVDHLRLALELGMHGVTANKGPVVHAYQELTALAAEQGRKFYFESAVMDGAPIFSLFREALPGANLISLRGVLNSTTNMILTRMEQGESFDAAVAYCQKIGIAETDPSGDIDGWDAAVKVAALATVLMKMPLKPADVEKQGIRHITPEEVARAKAAGQRWKLVCSARWVDGALQARVAPQRVGPDTPLYSINGSSSYVEFALDVLPGLGIVESHPSPETTAYGLLSDLVNVLRGA